MRLNHRYLGILLLIPLVFSLASCKSNRTRNLIADAAIEEPPIGELLPPSLAPVEPAPPIVVDPPVVELPIAPDVPVNPPATPPAGPPVTDPVDPPIAPPPPVAVPEPLSLLGAGAAFALGLKFKQRTKPK